MGAKPKRCVHCLRLEAFEADHVLADSWYPDTTPTTVQRWTAPSCPRCNRTFGELETDLLARIIGCVDPKSEAASGLHSKVLRSLGIEAPDLSEREKAIRNSRRDRIRAEFIPIAEVADLPGRIPGLCPPTQQAGEFATPIRMDGLSMIAEKIARGCEYNHKRRKRYVEPPYGVRTSMEETGIVPEPFASASQIIDFGPGCKVSRVFVTEDHNIVFYWITVWGTLHMHARIDLEATLQKIPFRKFEGLPLGPKAAAMKVPNYLREFDKTS